MQNANLPIGVFDSGVGGLTVLRALVRAFPHERFLYLGDTARLPYGTKSQETVTQYSLSATQILIEKGIKSLVVACNTASSVAIPALMAAYDIPVFGVVEPSAKLVAETVTSGKVVVLATDSTVRWHAYQQAIAHHNPHVEVLEWPCPLFVALAEEGWTDGPLVKSIVQEVLKDILQENLQAIVLGCTHFPLLKPVIESALPHVPIIDSASAIVSVLKNQLDSMGLNNPQTTRGELRFFATDGIERFTRIANRFLGIDFPQEAVALVGISHSQLPDLHRAP